MISSCPGSGKFKQPEPQAIKCRFCGRETEIWSDESQTKCDKCKKVVARELGQSCLDWCKHARECMGFKKP